MRLDPTQVISQLRLELSETIVDPITQANQAIPNPLTPRELEVLRLLATGLSNRKIAESLVFTHGTVRWYLNQIYSKLHVSSRTQAIIRARELKLLP
jgi:LuxR family maltose regulon positive regulatory protein